MSDQSFESKLKMEPFKEWVVQTFPTPNSIVGRVRDGSNCPLAHYLQSVTGESYLRVTKNIVELEVGETQVMGSITVATLPSDLEAFVRYADWSPVTYLGWAPPEDITRDEVLAIIEEVEGKEWVLLK